MKDQGSLTPKEAAYVAANAYYTLKDWATGNPTAGKEDAGVVKDQVLGAGKHSLQHTSIGRQQAKIGPTMTANTGLGAGYTATTGFGYFLSFERGGRKHAVVATRGTRPEYGFYDLVTDARIAPVGTSACGPVHKGFAATFDSLKGAIGANLDMLRSAHYVHCVGHSLGGAVANLVASHLSGQMGGVKLYTFGAPRVGLYEAYPGALEKKLGKTNIYRVGHDFDPITMIPIFPFQHVLPQDRDENNISLRSPVGKPDMANHSMERYIEKASGKTWGNLRADALHASWEDRLWAKWWESDAGWMKKAGGLAASGSVWILMKLLKGLLAVLSTLLVVPAATALDLLAQLLYFGYRLLTKVGEKIREWIQMAAQYVGVALKKGADITLTVVKYLLERLWGTVSTAALLALEATRKTGQVVSLAATGLKNAVTKRF